MSGESHLAVTDALTERTPETVARSTEVITTITQLRARARRYRELAESHAGDIADGLRQAADGVDRQAEALEAYSAAARLTQAHELAITA